jgi:hypothetical protein
MRLKAYESATIYKEIMKRLYDKRLWANEFKEGDKVLPWLKVQDIGERQIEKQLGWTVCRPLTLTKWHDNNYGYKTRSICG